jgi:mono/diheme cytochrome c family protein
MGAPKQNAREGLKEGYRLGGLAVPDSGKTRAGRGARSAPARLAFAGKKRLPLGLCGLCFLAVVGLGYLGETLVYAKPASQGQKVESSDELVRRGAGLFSKDCAACHYTDSKETKAGPGLKGILSGETLPVSGPPAKEKTCGIN